MQDSQLYFLIVAEELSITKAAERVFISQQCMSSHIKRMEETYNTKLFVRRPKLALTPAGERLVNTLRQIKQLEDNFRSEISDVNNLCCGQINLGITWSRAAILLPQLMSTFKELYPNVDVNIFNNLTDNLENRLVCGYLDLAVSTAQINSEDIEVIPLLYEKPFFVISDSLLRRCFPDDPEGTKQRLLKGVQLTDVKDVPLLLNTEKERFGMLLEDMFQEQRIHPKVIFRSDSSDIRSQMCGMDMGASIFAETLIQYVRRQNLIQPKDNQLNVFPLIGAPSYRMIAYFHRKAFIPHYLQCFIELLTNYAALLRYADENSALFIGPAKLKLNN